MGLELLSDRTARLHPSINRECAVTDVPGVSRIPCVALPTYLILRISNCIYMLNNVYICNGVRG